MQEVQESKTLGTLESVDNQTGKNVLQKDRGEQTVSYLDNLSKMQIKRRKGWEDR